MKIKPQVIKKDGKKEYVIIPYSDYLKIQTALEDYEDLKDLRSAKAATINEPNIPFNIVEQKIKSRGKKVRSKLK